MPPVRTALAWHQPEKAVRSARRLRLIKGRPRTTERVGCLRDRVAIDLDAPDHFVFHLDQVARIEKLVGAKKGVADLLRVGMQGAMGAQGLHFGLAPR
jgi:hypothetical protein